MMGDVADFARGFVSRAVQAGERSTVGEVSIIWLVLFYRAGGVAIALYGFLW
jgi:hypothetical protein